MPTAEAQSTQGYPGRWVAMGVLIAATFMNLLDATIVNVALPVIQKDLNAHSSSIEWIVAGYVLVFALALMPCGRLGDIYGKKQLFLGGVAFFTLSSALSGAAPNIGFLIAARLMQGLGAAIMAPQVLSLVQDMFVSKERSAAFSMFGITSGIAIVSGPLIGGWLIAVNLFDMGWRSIFYINVPVGIIAVIAGSVLIPRFPAQRGLKLDKPGVMIVALAFLLLIFPLVEGRRFGWPLWTFAMLLASLPFFAGFYFWEKRRADAGREQLLPVSLMHTHAYVLGGIISFLFYSTPAGLFMTFAIFLQQGFGFTPLQAGLATIPFPIGAFMAAFTNRRLSDNFLKGRILVGAALMTSGLALILFMVWRHSGTPGVFSFAPGLLIGGFSLGFTVSPLFQSMLAEVPGPDAGSASGALQAIQQAGSALGIAIASQLFFATIAARQAAGAATEAAYVAGFIACLSYMVVITAAVFFAAWFLPAVRPGQHAGSEDGETEVILL
ncbi:MFS transporter [Martelella alba]|uniref:MFS transporter n=1 Tax=Martelella alba TaxID=2590451 RepID=A0A506UB31_9HYPH|nr:MFS transporter [Martelella alba]TPW30145.1 MFS transporter [Martelella alba]